MKQMKLKLLTAILLTMLAATAGCEKSMIQSRKQMKLQRLEQTKIPAQTKKTEPAQKRQQKTSQRLRIHKQILLQTMEQKKNRRRDFLNLINTNPYPGK